MAARLPIRGFRLCLHPRLSHVVHLRCTWFDEQDGRAFEAGSKKGISVGRIKESVLAEQRGHFSFISQLSVSLCLRESFYTQIFSRRYGASRDIFRFFPNIALRVVLFGVWRYWLKVGLCRPEFAIAIAGLLLHDR